MSTPEKLLRSITIQMSPGGSSPSTTTPYLAYLLPYASTLFVDSTDSTTKHFEPKDIVPSANIETVDNSHIIQEYVNSGIFSRLVAVKEGYSLPATLSGGNISFESSIFDDVHNGTSWTSVRGFARDGKVYYTVTDAHDGEFTSLVEVDTNSTGDDNQHPINLRKITYPQSDCDRPFSNPVISSTGVCTIVHGADGDTWKVIKRASNGEQREAVFTNDTGSVLHTIPILLIDSTDTVYLINRVGIYKVLSDATTQQIMSTQFGAYLASAYFDATGNFVIFAPNTNKTRLYRYIVSKSGQILSVTECSIPIVPNKLLLGVCPIGSNKLVAYNPGLYSLVVVEDSDEAIANQDYDAVIPRGTNGPEFFNWPDGPFNVAKLGEDTSGSFNNSTTDFRHAYVPLCIQYNIDSSIAYFMDSLAPFVAS